MPDCGTISPGLYSCAMAVLQINLSMISQTEFSQAAFLGPREAGTPGCAQSLAGFDRHRHRCRPGRPKRCCTSRVIRRERWRFVRVGLRVGCRAPRLSSAIEGGSARLALLGIGSLISRPSAPRAAADDV